MKPLSFKRHRFPAEVIRHAVWLYFRFSLSLRDVEELLAARGIDVSYETIRCWTVKFGPRRFLTTHAAIYNTFYTQRHLISRPTLRRFRSDAASAWAAATA